MRCRCTICSKVIEGKLMKYHLRIDHKTTITNFGCSAASCSRTFSALNSLNNHWLKEHSDNKAKSNVSHIEQSCFVPTIYESIPEESQLVENSIVSPIDCPKVDESVEESGFFPYALEVASSLYGDVQLSRKQANSMISQIDNLLNGDFVKSLKILVLNSVDTSLVDVVDRQFYDLQSSFSRLNSEHKCLSILRKRECFIDPQKITFGFREELKSGLIDFTRNVGAILPLKVILKKFFELPEVFEKTINYVMSLQSEKKVSNIMQTEFWKIKSSDVERDGIVLPLFLYEDDFESGNPLGSHATVYKMAAMYISLPCLPPKFRSKLNNIFLFQIAHTSDVNEYSDEQVYRDVIEQLNALATTGIELDIEGKKFKVYFKLALIIGDNLGLNRLLGFTTSFNANYFCRFCKVTKLISHKQHTENAHLLRRLENYTIDIEENDVKKTGIKTKCIWNDVIGFHVTENFSVDIVHDLFEGVCNYDMGKILYEMVVQQKLFTIDSLNFKLKFFEFPKGNSKPPLITSMQLKNQYLKMSAAEMKCFILNCSLILGELIPRTNKYWKLYLLLRQIVSLTLQTSVSNEDIKTLKDLIKQHHILYVKLFSNTLKPKYHHMIHYSLIMEIIGPLIHTWTMRFEAKHRPLKQSAVSSNNRINLPLTIAIKQQFCMSEMFLNRVGFKETPIFEKLPNQNERPIVQMKDSRIIDDFYQIKSLTLNDIKYDVDTVVRISVDELPMFGRLRNIFRKRLNCSSDDTDFLFIVRIFKSVEKDEHLQSFRLMDTNSHQLITLKSLPSIAPRNMVTLSNGHFYIAYDYYLQ